MKGVMSRLRTAPAKPSYASQQPTTAVPTPAAKTAVPAKTAAPSGSGTGQTFAQAYAAAREAGGSKAQFKWTDPKTGKTGTFQAAATKKEYVPMSQQKKVDVTPKTTTAAPAPKPAETPAPAAEKPTTTPTPATAATPQNPDQERTKVKAPLPSMAQSGGGASNDMSSGAEKMKAMSSMKPEPAPKKDAGTTPSKTFAESVEVGDYKYRII